MLLQLAEAREKIQEFHQLPGNTYFEHPYFRKVSKEKTPRFLVVHTRHHLKIIKDIMKEHGSVGAKTHKESVPPESN